MHIRLGVIIVMSFIVKGNACNASYFSLSLFFKVVWLYDFVYDMNLFLVTKQMFTLDFKILCLSNSNSRWPEYGLV